MIERVGSEDGAGSLGAAGADEAREAENLAMVSLERNVNQFDGVRIASLDDAVLRIEEKVVECRAADQVEQGQDRFNSQGPTPKTPQDAQSIDTWELGVGSYLGVGSCGVAEFVVTLRRGVVPIRMIGA